MLRRFTALCVLEVVVGRQQIEFTTFIEGPEEGEGCSAHVTMVKLSPLDISQNVGEIALAHAYITPVSGQHFKGWEGLRKGDEKTGEFKTQKIHGHFILRDLSGDGVYIKRDSYGNDEQAVHCSIWSLGLPFATRFMNELKYLT